MTCHFHPSVRFSGLQRGSRITHSPSAPSDVHGITSETLGGVYLSLVKPPDLTSVCGNKELRAAG